MSVSRLNNKNLAQDVMATLEIVPLSAASSALQHLFNTVNLPESGWAWFEVLASATLASSENAVIAALVDEHGSYVSAVPLVAQENCLTRTLTSPYTTLFQPPLGRP